MTHKRRAAFSALILLTAAHSHDDRNTSGVGAERRPNTLVPADAKPALPLIPMQPVPANAVPGTFGGDFELSTVGPGQTQSNPSWLPWAFVGSSGITDQAAPLAAGNGSAPSGARVAWLSGTASISVRTSLPIGPCRVRYFAARRLQAGVLDPQELEIRINGVLVAADEDVVGQYWGNAPGDTGRRFASRPIQNTSTGSQLITFTGTGPASATVFLDGVTVEPLRAWQDPTSWAQGSVPQPCCHVNIPNNAAIALGGSAVPREIMLFGELLALEGTTQLTTERIHVTGKTARLEAGRRRVPMQGNFGIELSGVYVANTCTAPTNNKSLMVEDGGRLELHGRSKASWTRLIATAPVGSIGIDVQDATGWAVGDEILIASSVGARHQPLPSQSERRSIKALTPITNGWRITLGAVGMPANVTSLTHQHLGETRKYPTTGPSRWTLDMRAEVGNLTRNVTVKGTVVPFPSAPGSIGSGFGGHIMIMKANVATALSGRARLSAIELKHMGQTGGLGRYPIHWHMCKDEGAGQYIINSAIHETFNRAVTIHGTDGVLVHDNVAYRNLGHAYFLEDASEQDNEITHNLAVSTLRPVPGEQVIPSDNQFNSFQNRTPAAFWITSPKNVVSDNVACDTVGTGFWLIFPETVLGLSNSTSPNSDPHNESPPPNRLNLGGFARNVAHGCGNGFDVHDGIQFATGCNPNRDLILPNVSWHPPAGTAEISDFTAYGCHTALYTGDGDSGGDVVFLRSVLADNEVGIRFASGDIIRDSVFVANTGLGIYAAQPAPPHPNFEACRLYDGATVMEDCLFIGYDAANTQFVSSNGAALRRTNHRFRNLTFDPLRALVTPRIEFPSITSPGGGTGAPPNAQDVNDPRSWGFSVWDVDGTTTGQALRSVISNHPWVLDGSESPWVNPVGGISQAMVSSNKFGHLYVMHLGHLPAVWNPPNSTVAPATTFERIKAGSPTLSFNNDYNTDQQRQVPVIVNQGYLYVVRWASPPQPPANFSERFRFRVGTIEANDAVIVKFEIAQPNASIVVRQNSAVFPVAMTLNVADLRLSPPGGQPLAHKDAAGNIWIRVMNQIASNDAFFSVTW